VDFYIVFPACSANLKKYGSGHFRSRSYVSAVDKRYIPTLKAVDSAISQSTNTESAYTEMWTALQINSST